MDRYQPSCLDINWQQDPERVGFVRDCLGLALGDREAIPDMAQMATYRYGRLQAQITRSDCAGALLFSPMNVRYATETLYAPITNMHSPTPEIPSSVTNSKKTQRVPPQCGGGTSTM